MAVTVRATDDGDGDWGGAALSDIEAVASSATQCFSVFGDEESVAITLLAMTKGPMTVQDPSLPLGEAVVWLSTHGTVWAQVAFQFAHEFCHVIADPKTMPWDHFLWIEEAICETASLFAVRCMAKTWTVAPPHPNWQDYAVKLDEYVSERMSEPEHCLPPGAQFHDWLADHLPLLEKDSGRREDNTIIAKELLPIFEGDPRCVGGRPLPAQLAAPAHGDTCRFLRKLGDGLSGGVPACSRRPRPSVEDLDGLTFPITHITARSVGFTSSR
jgi:hypothetical protein